MISMDLAFEKIDLLESINQIDKNPNLIKGRHSSTYDLIYNDRKYPPILVLSVANTLKGRKELTLEDFGNNVETPFKILRDKGFEVVPKSKKMKPNIYDFIKVSDEQVTGKGTSDSAKLFARDNKGDKEGLSTEISFGVGRASAIPWIAFTGFKQTIKNGIYPVYLYYKTAGKLILAYGISETNKPKYSWSINDVSNTIEQYLNSNFGKLPERYGNSYVFKVYDVKSLPEPKSLEEDLLAIIQEYKLLFTENKTTIKIKDEPFSVLRFGLDIKNSGLLYSSSLILRFTASLLTKPFVILTGLSGSGKTKLAQSFVQWICESDSQYKIVPVGADWTNREPLLGYPNALQPKEYVKPDSGVLDLIIRANEYKDEPHFFILDEMNLSHVERYFADFLSVMESNEYIPLHPGFIENGIPSKLKISSNLFIIGTVNIDETTNMFSPKVLDRANTIEFRVRKEEMENFLDNIKDINMDVLTGKGASMGKSFKEMAINKSFATKDIEVVNNALIQFFGELKRTGAEFGYRSATEILRLIHQLSILNDSITTNQKIDIAIMQKLLPKLHGSRRKLTPVLEKLASFCVETEVKIIKEVFENDDFIRENKSIIKYPLSLEKIIRMYRSAVDNGFASFAEA